MHGGELFTKSRGTRGTLERKYFAAIYESNIPIYCHQCKPQTFKLHPGISEVARPLFIQIPGRRTSGSRKLSDTDITYFRRYSCTRYFVGLLACYRKKKSGFLCDVSVVAPAVDATPHATMRWPFAQAREQLAGNVCVLNIDHVDLPSVCGRPR